MYLPYTIEDHLDGFYSVLNKKGATVFGPADDYDAVHDKCYELNEHERGLAECEDHCAEER